MLLLRVQVAAMDEDELFVFAKQIQAPFSLVQEVAKTGRLPVVNFAAGGIATPADAALMMQLGVDGESAAAVMMALHQHSTLASRGVHSTAVEFLRRSALLYIKFYSFCFGGGRGGHVTHVVSGHHG